MRNPRFSSVYFSIDFGFYYKAGVVCGMAAKASVIR